MDILLGMELRFDDGPEDYLIYGFEEDFLYRNPYLNRLTLASFRDRIRKEDSDILIFQAHPFRKGLKTASLDLLDGVEGFNGNPRQISHNDEAFAFCLAGGLYLSSGSGEPMDILFKL
mgnify:FL=1